MRRDVRMGLLGGQHREGPSGYGCGWRLEIRKRKLGGWWTGELGRHLFLGEAMWRIGGGRLDA